ncbi:MAG TPA: hypothetical protein VF174_07025 [Micromonosporaceae bacterium]
MAHVELSLSDAFGRRQDPVDSLANWVASVAVAAEPCLIIDVDAVIAAASVSCCDLLGLGSPDSVVGQPLLDGNLRLVDFTTARNELTDAEVDKIPPLLALTSGRLAHGLLRVRTDPDGRSDATVDAIATPLLVDGAVAGSLTFFSEV